MISDLNAQLTRAQADLRALQNARTARFGAPPAETATMPRIGATYHPRRTGVELVFDTVSDTTMPDARTTHANPGSPANTDARVFNPIGPWSEATEYTVTNRGTAVTDGFDLEPVPVLFNRSGSNRRVFTASSPNTAHFPGRGTVYRGLLRHVLDSDTTGSNNNDNRGRNWIYSVSDRLIVQGQDPEPCTGGVYNADTNRQGCGESHIADGKSSAPQSNSGRYNNWDAVPRMTFQYKSGGGFTMGFGGEGVIFGDLERYAAKGGDNCGAGNDEYCDESTTANVEFSFGQPQADPYGQPSTNYWYAEARSPRLPAAAAPDLAAPGDRIPNHEFGRYEMILSAHAGEDRRLAYAAYGLSRFIDYTTTNPRLGRMQVFHYGLDAFADSDGRRPADLTGADKIEGTFRGKTAAWIVTSITKKLPSPDFFNYAPANLYRARGDIELRACIGDSNCTLDNFAGSPLTMNQVAGYIRNLEYAPPEALGRRWSQKEEGGLRIGGDGLEGTDTATPSRAGIELAVTSIGTDGAYSGRAIPRYLDSFRPGTYEGSFYGPTGRGMEAAGTWQVNMTHLMPALDAIIGSFGAICEGDCQPEPAATP